MPHTSSSHRLCVMLVWRPRHHQGYFLPLRAAEDMIRPLPRADQKSLWRSNWPSRVKLMEFPLNKICFHNRLDLTYSIFMLLHVAVSDPDPIHYFLLSNSANMSSCLPAVRSVCALKPKNKKTKKEPHNTIQAKQRGGVCARAQDEGQEGGGGWGGSRGASMTVLTI